MKILVRLPNWLGDMVMGTGLLRSIQEEYPDAIVDVIAKKELGELADLIPGVNNKYLFSKKEWKGISGAWRFGKMISEKEKYDLFVCMPDSFSSALMASATGIKTRIGFKKELRSFLLTKTFKKPRQLHRTEEYTALLEKYTGKKYVSQVQLLSNEPTVSGRIIINFNSESVTSRMPLPKAVAIMNMLLQQINGYEFVFIGSKKEKLFVDSIINQLPAAAHIINKAGETSLLQLAHLLKSGQLILTTDSGPAHLGNALGVYTIVMNGAGDEKNTSPYNADLCRIIRYGKLECEPCVKNTCKYGAPLCLEKIDEAKITEAVIDYLKQSRL